MALFGFKKKDEVVTPKAEAKAPRAESTKTAKVKTATGSVPQSLAHVLRNPRVTEKGTMHAEAGTYLFDVAPSATKFEIARAVSAAYNVTPRMVRIVTIPSKRKRNMRTGQTGVKRGGKKAYVYLKKGETIAST